MKEEIDNAAEFLGKLLKIGCSKLSCKQMEAFVSKLEKLLYEHIQNHWFPQKPFKGSGYRCLRINHKMDPIIAKAAEASGLRSNELQSVFPNELTMWIDPREVSYRIGENGSICVLYDGVVESSQSSSDSDVDPVPDTKTKPAGSPSNHSNQQNLKYSHPFPTPPSSPPTIQDYHLNYLRHTHVPPAVNTCRKDLNAYWTSNNPSVITDSRPNAMFHMDQMAYVAS